jgi:hypothetical protein
MLFENLREGAVGETRAALEFREEGVRLFRAYLHKATSKGLPKNGNKLVRET